MTTPLSDKGAKQRRTPLQRAQDNPGSMRLAIDAMCFQCQDDGMNTPHVTKGRVRDCSTEKCPLWHVRGWRGVTTRKPRMTPAISAPN